MPLDLFLFLIFIGAAIYLLAGIIGHALNGDYVGLLPDDDEGEQ